MEFDSQFKGLHGAFTLLVYNQTLCKYDRFSSVLDWFTFSSECRHSRAQFTSPQNASPGTSEATAPVSNANVTTSYTPTASTSIPSNALALPDPPAPVKTSKEQDLIDLLSLTLSTTKASSPHAPPTPPSASQHQVPVPPSSQGYPYASQTYPASQAQLPYNSYVVPWAQPQKSSQPQVQPQPTQFQTEPQAQNQSNSPSQAQHQFQARSQPHQLNTQSQIRLQPQSPSQSQSPHQSFGQPQYQPYFQPQYTSAYPPPPWAATPGYFNSQNHRSSTNNMISTPQVNTTASNSITGPRPLQHNSSFPIRGTNGGAPINRGDSWTSTGPRNPAPTSGQKPFIPSYLLFEDLNVLGNGDGRRSSTSPNLSGSNTQSMVGGRK
ncbi:hypothetical protein Gotur_007403 [Gossypium turneri]